MTRQRLVEVRGGSSEESNALVVEFQSGKGDASDLQFGEAIYAKKAKNGGTFC